MYQKQWIEYLIHVRTNVPTAETPTGPETARDVKGPTRHEMCGCIADHELMERTPLFQALNTSMDYLRTKTYLKTSTQLVEPEALRITGKRPFTVPFNVALMDVRTK